MDPFSMAVAGSVATVAGGATNAFGQLQAGDATSNMYKYKAGVAKLNEQTAKQNAEYALTSSEANAKRKGMETAFVLGKQTVAQAANGFDVNSGTNVGVRDSTAALGRMDAGVIREEGSRKAYGYQIKATSEAAEAQADLIAGDNAKKAAKIQALGTILGTAGSVGSKWYQGKQSFGEAT